MQASMSMRVLAIRLALSIFALGPIRPASAGDPPLPPPPAGASDVARADALDAEVEALRRTGDFRKALPLAREALALRERAYGPEDPRLGDPLSTVGFMLWRQAAYAEAKDVFARVVRILEKAHGLAHPDVSKARFNLAAQFQGLGDLEGARKVYEEVLKAQEKALGPDRADTALTRINLGQVLQLGGHLHEARPHFERALATFEKVSGPDHPNTILAVGSLGALCEQLGLLARARELLERAEDACLRTLGPSHPDTATSIQNLGGVLEAMGRYEEARVRYVRSLSIYERAAGPDHPNTATALNNLAELLKRMGRYEEARPLYERALAAYEKTFGPEHAAVAYALGNLAGLLHRMGQQDASRPLFGRALLIHEKTLGPDHPAVARSLLGVADLLLEDRKPDAALPLFERALAINEKALGHDHGETASALVHLANVHFDAGRYEPAIPLVRRALSIREATSGPENPETATCLQNLGTILLKSRRPAEARPFLARALAIEEKSVGLNHPTTALTIHNLAEVLDALGDSSGALKLRQRALDAAIEGVRRSFAALQPSERAALAHTLRQHFDGWLAGAERARLPGFAQALRIQGLATRAGEADRILARRGVGAAAAVLADLVVAERRLSRLSNEVPTTRQTERLLVWREQFAAASAERDRLARSLVSASAPYRTALERLDVGVADVQRSLSKDAVLIDYLKVADRYVAWVLPSSGDVVQKDLGSAVEIEAAAVDFGAEAANFRSGDAWRGSGARLRSLVLDPLRSSIPADVRRWFVVPDAGLGAVPLWALPSGDGDATVGDAVRIAYLGMAQDLVPRTASPAPTAGALLVGGVDYAHAGDPVPERPVPGTATPPPGAPAPPPAPRFPRGAAFEPLAATLAEVASVESSLKRDCVVLLGGRATEAGVRASAHGKAILHFATHGIVRDDVLRGLGAAPGGLLRLTGDRERFLGAGHDPLNLAGLALAGASARDGGSGDDGILTSNEASYLDLEGTRLVVLSACQTALGREEAGECVLGLVYGFRMAGAAQILASLWKVDDDATRALMEAFYAGWSAEDRAAGRGADVALRRAQEGVRAQPKWKHPYYWAAWGLWSGAP